MSLLEGISFGGKGNDGDKVSEEGPNKRRRLDLAADDLFGAGSKKVRTFMHTSRSMVLFILGDRRLHSAKCK